MILQGFVGGQSAVRSPNANAERTYNWILEKPPGYPKVPAYFVPTPGVSPFVVLPEGPIRGLFEQDDRAWAVAGASLYELFANQTYVSRGTAIADGKPATFACNGANGNQLLISSGGKAYVQDLVTNIVTEVTTNAEPVAMVTTSDGYGIALQQNSNQFNISALNDFTTWDPIDVYAVSTVPDELRAIWVNHRELYTAGSQNTSVWQNTGDADVPFQPASGVQIHQGIGAVYAFTLIDNTAYFLGANANGNRIVYRYEGYSPKRVSDTAIEFILNNYPRVDDAEMWSYQDEGHAFVVLYLPSPPDVQAHEVDHTTLVYDISTDTWHCRALWDPTLVRWNPHLARNHCVAFGHHLVGDRAGNGVYRLSLAYATNTIAVVA